MLTLFSYPVVASNCSLSSRLSLWKMTACSIWSPALCSAAAAAAGVVDASTPTWLKKPAERLSSGTVPVVVTCPAWTAALTVPIIEHQNVGFMLVGIKMRIEACRYLTWKACHDLERTGGRADELAIMTKVYCSEAAVDTVYNCMRVVGIASYTKDLAPLEKIMRDAMVFPLYDGGNQGVRRRQLHDIVRHPGYDSMLAARGEGLPGDR